MGITGAGSRPEPARYRLVVVAPVEELEIVLRAFTGLRTKKQSA
jgi:hypothetical protein